jgi:hypothetical protein
MASVAANEPNRGEPGLAELKENVLVLCETASRAFASALEETQPTGQVLEVLLPSLTTAMIMAGRMEHVKAIRAFEFLASACVLTTDFVRLQALLDPDTTKKTMEDFALRTKVLLEEASIVVD